jgi:rare lipoprotein A (peptidoglycan hydrolase)
MTIGFQATQSASGQDAGVSLNANSQLAYGQALKVSGQVSGASRGDSVRLQYASRGRGFRTVDTGETGRDGRYSLRHTPVRTGTARVLTSGASASGTRTVKVGARIATAQREHVKQGRRAKVSGRLKPGNRGRTVSIQQRKNSRWVTVDRDRTGADGRFAGSWAVKRGAGRYRMRVVFRGDRRNTRTVNKGRLLVYRPGQASYYGPGLYGNRTACGQTLTPGTMGVANRWLPCGTRVTFRYRGRAVTVPVIDRGPFHGSRIWDLTYATKRKLGFGSTGVIWSTR